MDQAMPTVRIVVVRPGLAPASAVDLGAASSSVRPGPDTASVLKRLGGGVEIERVDSLRGCLACLAENEADLVVVEVLGSPRARQRGEEELGRLLEKLRGDGPPVVVVSEKDDEDTALAAFKHGAADCVRIADDYGEVLPFVALEQIRRWRRTCERVRTRRRIEWLEHLNNAIVSEIPAALLVADGAGRVVVVNPESSRSLGISPADAVGKLVSDVLPADLIDSAGIREGLVGGRPGRGQAPRLGTTVGSDGKPRVLDVRWQQLDADGRVLFVLSDVTERHVLARRVSDLQRYNDNIIKNINSALVVVDEGGEIAFANPTAEKILGSESGGLIGRPIWPWFRAPSRDQLHLARTLDKGERFRGAEALVTRPDGSLVPIGISSTPLLDGRGAKLGAVAIFQDLTEIKELQRQVLQSEKMASIGQLAAGVAHEINNPMGFIHANLFQLSEYVSDLKLAWREVQALRESLSSGDQATVEEAAARFDEMAKSVDIDFLLRDISQAVRESQEGSERIRHIVQDLRDFSHPDTAEPQPADVNQCVDSTASIVWTMMKHSVVLEKKYGELPAIKGYPMQLKQVFMNLLVNAYQSIEEVVGRSGETGRIEIETAAEAGGVRVSIRDTGAGIAKEHMERLFDPFFTTKEVGAGTGLGLSTSYGIVRRHGGTIRVESEIGKGSTFEVWLPDKADGLMG